MTRPFAVPALLLILAGAGLADPRFASLKLTSQPDSATVLIDWNECGHTPFILDSIAPGKHLVIVSKANLPSVNKQVTFKGGECVQLKAMLVKDQAITSDNDTRRKPGESPNAADISQFTGLLRVWNDSTDGDPEPDWFVDVKVSPELIATVAPSYPNELKKAKATGKAIINMLLDEKGKVIRTEIIESSGWAQFDKVAREAALKFKFIPAIGAKGKPVKVWVAQPFIFKLE